MPAATRWANLFLNKMKDPKEDGTRLGIVFNGSPLFTGLAGSGESNIRQWIIENDGIAGIRIKTVNKRRKERGGETL